MVSNGSDALPHEDYDCNIQRDFNFGAKTPFTARAKETHYYMVGALTPQLSSSCSNGLSASVI